MTDARGNARPNGDGSVRHTPGTPCWVSLMVRGLDATEQFYGALFGWEFRPGPRPLGPYVRAVLDGYPVAGIGVLSPDRRLPAAWTPYFASDDVDLTAEVVRSCGGTVGVGPLDADDAGGWRSSRTRAAPSSASGRRPAVPSAASPAGPALRRGTN